MTLLWQQGSLILELENFRGRQELVARGVRELIATRRFEWGRSSSVNVVMGPTALEDSSGYRLEIEMQSGDRLQIVAETFEMPELPSAQAN